MAMVVPTILVLILTALIGWGLYALVHKLDRMGGEGNAVRGQVQQPEETPSQE